MSKNKKVYNEDHMTTLVTKYESAANKIVQIVNTLASSSGAKQILMDNYEGQGKELAEDLFDKIEEHLLLLHTCCSSMGEYVKISLDNMKEQDQLLSKEINKKII